MPYAACPKCGHAPLPADQALPAACPACGLVLAKYGTVPTRHASSADVERNDSDAEEGTTREWLARWLLHVPDRVAKTSWSLRIATLAVFALGLLRRAQPIGLFFGWVGKAMMLAALLWAAWLLRLQRAHLSDSLGH